MYAIDVMQVGKCFKIEERTKDKSSLRYLFTKSTKELWALKNITLKVRKGEFLGIIGENGAGKSTLLKIMAGIIKETEGKVKIDGKISSFLELGVGLEPELNGKENVRLYASILDIPQKLVKDNINQIFKFAELEGFKEIKIKKYSDGMKLRLAFSIALLSNPDIFLVDEVFNIGDEYFKRRCLEKLKQLKKEGKTFVFASHDLNMINKFCDKVILLEKGVIKKYGLAKKITEEYLENIYFKERKKIFDTMLKNLKKKEKEMEKNMRKRIEEKIHREGRIDKEIEEKKHIEKEMRKKIEEIKERIAKKNPELYWGNRWGTGEIKIKSIKCFDSNDKERYSYQDNEPLNIKISYHTKKKIKNPEFGIAIYDLENNLLLSSNTTVTNKKIKEVYGGGIISCSLAGLPFKKGIYKLSVAICKKKGPSYDHLHKLVKIKIFNEKQLYNKGILNIPCKWV